MFADAAARVPQARAFPDARPSAQSAVRLGGRGGVILRELHADRQRGGGSAAGGWPPASVRRRAAGRIDPRGGAAT